jgi:hypothetical protein
MKPDRLAKIRAIAEDPRGDPKVRAIAQAKLDAEQPPAGPRNPQHPGMRTTAEYERWKRAVQGKRR